MNRKRKKCFAIFGDAKFLIIENKRSFNKVQSNAVKAYKYVIDKRSFEPISSLIN